MANAYGRAAGMGLLRSRRPRTGRPSTVNERGSEEGTAGEVVRRPRVPSADRGDDAQWGEGPEPARGPRRTVTPCVRSRLRRHPSLVATALPVRVVVLAGLQRRRLVGACTPRRPANGTSRTRLRAFGRSAGVRRRRSPPWPGSWDDVGPSSPLRECVWPGDRR